MSISLKSAIHAFKNEGEYSDDAYCVTVRAKEPTELVITLHVLEDNVKLVNTWTVAEDGSFIGCPVITLECLDSPPKVVSYLLNKVYWGVAYFAAKGKSSVRMVFEGQQLELDLTQSINLSDKFVELEGKTDSPARV